MKQFLNKKKTNQGFTLAELLIVVAIIAVLVAIAIPIFTKRLESSRETTDIANLRSAYAAAQTAILAGAGDIPADTCYYDPSDDVGVVTGESAKTKIGQGTSTDAKTDTSALPSAITYTTSVGVKKHSIEIEFDDYDDTNKVAGGIKSIKFN